MPIPRALIRFSYGEHVAPCREELDIVALRCALQDVKATLQRLVVCLNADEDDADEPPFETLRSLQDWSVLTEIRSANRGDEA